MKRCTQWTCQSKRRGLDEEKADWQEQQKRISTIAIGHSDMRNMDRNTVQVQVLDIMERVQYIEYNEVSSCDLLLKAPVGE